MTEAQNNLTDHECRKGGGALLFSANIDIHWGRNFQFASDVKNLKMTTGGYANRQTYKRKICYCVTDINIDIPCIVDCNS